MLLNILSILVFTAFLYVVYKKGNGIQSSISKGFYLFETNTGKTLYYFSYLIFCWLLFASDPSPIMFFACTAISFVGTATDYKSGGITYTVHVAGAGLGIGLAILSLWVDNGMQIYSLVLAGLVILTNKYVENNRTWWAECMSFYGVALGKFIYLIS